ncbi:helix-turn-helix transcriptional regulator [Litoreibacter ponti]|uniref:helix-turn-helix transcriptional regulator n=1 Tax=Litoreibacter ponti TaxID=1510457 RepID=UPI0013048F7B|nr:LuxR family transcriptional regulator [Litoreibacter ponti]
MTLEDFLTRLAGIETADALWTLILDFAHDAGFKLVSYHHFDMAEDGASRETAIQTDGFPREWVCHYIDDALSMVDPIPIAAVMSTEPFFWSDVGERMTLTAHNSAYLDELLAAGLGDGIAMQVFGPLLRNGYFGLGFGGPRREMEQSEIRAIQVGLQAAHLRYCSLVPRAIEGGQLSPREAQVLELVAIGRSNGEVAAALGVSRSTVDTLMKRIFVKLDVDDRTTAAIKAIGAGLISLSRNPAHEK